MYMCTWLCGLVVTVCGSGCMAAWPCGQADVWMCGCVAMWLFRWCLGVGRRLPPQ